MAESKLNYVGPLPGLLPAPATSKAWWRKVPMPFIVIVALPTLIAAIYYLLIASPKYVSEARFVVRAPSQSQPSSLGVALQGVGLSSTQTDAFVVHEYIDSHDGLAMLGRKLDVSRVLSPPGADIFSRYPSFWETRSDEGLLKAYRRSIVVGYDSTTGISTLRVTAFRAKDAQAVAEVLLSGSENLVNRLNRRSVNNAVAEAAAARDRAIQKVAASQARLMAFRNSENLIDPELSARESSGLIGTLRASLASLEADRSQLLSEAPNSPQLSSLNSRIAAIQQQIAVERQSIVGSSGSLANKVGAYEDLVMARELSDKELAATTAALTTAEQESRRQQLYLERVVSPNLPELPTRPRRLISVLTAFFSAMLLYGVGWLIYAGVREHRQS